jgi:hypothetical protein
MIITLFCYISKQMISRAHLYAYFIIIQAFLLTGCVSILQKAAHSDHRLYGTEEELAYNCLVVENVLGEPNQVRIYLYDTAKTTAIAVPNTLSNCLEWEQLAEGKEIYIPFKLCRPNPPSPEGDDLTAYILDFSKMYFLAGDEKNYLFEHPCWRLFKPSLETPTLDLNIHFSDSYSNLSSTLRGIFTFGKGNKDRYPSGAKLYLVPPSHEVLSDSWGLGRYICVCPKK